MGGFEARALARAEPSLKYHPCITGILTLARDPGREKCLVGSLTGAVASQIVTEAPQGSLSAIGNRANECKGIRELNCETHKSSRCESRA